MLISAQQTSHLQKTARTDLDPNTAAASALYSGMATNAQPLTNIQATPASVAGNAQADNVNAAFAKTRVMLQASTAQTSAPSQKTATEEFKDYMSKPVAQRVREEFLKAMGLTEDDVKAMPPEKQQALNDRINDLMKQKEVLNQTQLAQQKAEKTGVEL